MLGVLYVIYEAAIADDDPQPSAITAQLDDLAEKGETLGARLDALRPSSRPASALKAAEQTLAATRRAGRAFRASDLPDTNAGARIKNGLGAEFEFVSGVIEVLKDPGSRVYGSLPGRADRARRALGAMPDDRGLPATVRGVDRLRRWAAAND